ncbi:MAG: hypothetical protein ACJ798_06660 [Phenylobacterium sp.]
MLGTGAHLARRLAAVAAAAAALIPAAVRAQVPPHAPGTVCYTPRFWCYARPPGPPGSPCICPTANGPVGGVRG